MEQQQRERDNDVNGSSFPEAAVESGRDGHSLQVVPDHHQATVGGQDHHSERVMTGRNLATEYGLSSCNMECKFVRTGWKV